MYGATTIKTNDILTIKFLTIGSQAKAVLFSGSFLRLTGLDILNEAARLDVQNSVLDFTSTSGGAIRIGYPFISQGRLGFDGKCTLRSSTGNLLRFDSNLTVEIFGGATVNVYDQTHIRIE